jgi:hypothetical protein
MVTFAPPTQDMRTQALILPIPRSTAADRTSGPNVAQQVLPCAPYRHSACALAT